MVNTYDYGIFDVDVFDSDTTPVCYITKGSTNYFPLLSCKVDLSMNGLSCTFSFVLANPNGANTNTFTQNDEVAIYMKDFFLWAAGTDYNVLSGNVDRAVLQTESKRDMVQVSGLGYFAKLQQRNANDSYSTREISTIIKNTSDGLMRYFPDFTTTGVDTTTTTLDTVNFLEKPISDCIQQLGDQINYDVQVDNSKGLQFHPHASTSSGFTFSTTDGTILKYNFEYDGKKIYTFVKVMGGYLNTPGFSDDKVGDGSAKSFVLGYQPENQTAVVTVAGAPVTEGVDYTIDYPGHTITFNTAPGAAAAIVITYTAMQQVTWSATDAVAAGAYGLRELKITDDSIKTMTRAAEIAQLNLDLYSDIRTVVKVTVQGIPSLSVGKTVLLTIPKYNVVAASYVAVEIHHSFGRDGFTSELVLGSAEIVSIPELLKKIQADLDEIRQREYNKNPSNIVPQLNSESGTGSAVQTIVVTTSSGLILDVANLDANDLDGGILYDTTIESGTPG